MFTTLISVFLSEVARASTIICIIHLKLRNNKQSIQWIYNKNLLQQMVNTFNYSYIQAIISQANFHHLTTLSSEMTDQPCITLLTRILITSTIADVLFIIIFLE